MQVLLTQMIDEFIIDCNKRNAPKLFRIHWDGDFFNDIYTYAWKTVIDSNPDIQFWVYTRVKSAALILKDISNLSLYYSTDDENKEIGHELKVMIKEGATLDTVMTILADNFGGAAAASAETAAGKFKILKNSLAETQESIGAALLPALQKVLPFLQKMADWAQNNPKVFLIVAGTISAVAASIMAINIAMALNPFGLIVIGTAAAGLAIYALSTRFETFGNVVRTVINSTIGYVQGLVDAFIMLANALVSVVNLFSPVDVAKLPSMTIPTLPSNIFKGSSPVGGGTPFTGDKDLGVKIPAMPTVPTIIAGGSSVGGGGGGSSSGGASLGVPGVGGAQVGALTTFGMAERIAAREAAPPVVINVTGGVSTSAEIGQSVYNALLQYKQVYGPLTAIAT